MLLSCCLMLAASACEMMEKSDIRSGEGGLVIQFSEEVKSMIRNLPTKAQAAIPDTNDFILKVTNSSGTSIYNGKYGAAPQTIIAEPGTYTIDIMSAEFSEPLFDTPQYGDTRTAKIVAGQNTTVNLECSQLNAGVKLNIDSDFLTSYPSGVLYLKGTGGKLMYSYTEKRIAYFQPGSVSLQLVQDSQTQTLLTRQLSAKQILQINISIGQSSSTAKSGINVSLDTCRVWTLENYVLGGDNDDTGDDTSTALSVSQARTCGRKTDVWVYGYIVGGDLSSSQCSFSAPFSSRTNLVLAGKSTCKDKEQCLSIQLSKGEIRDQINLVDNPDFLGRQIYLKGDIVDAYYGIPGLQSITEYKWK